MVKINYNNVYLATSNIKIRVEVNDKPSTPTPPVPGNNIAVTGWEFIFWLYPRVLVKGC